MNLNHHKILSQNIVPEKIKRSTCQIRLCLHHLQILHFHGFHGFEDHFPCPPGLLTDIDGCKCTVDQFEPSKHVLCAFHNNTKDVHNIVFSNGLEYSVQSNEGS